MNRAISVIQSYHTSTFCSHVRIVIYPIKEVGYTTFFFYRSKKTAHCLLNIILNCRCVVIDVKKNGNVRYIPERSRYSIIIFYAVLPICGHLRMPLSTGSPDLRFYGWSDNTSIAMGKSRVRGVAS